MAFDYESLMEGDAGEGLDATLRALAKAAYDQGYVDGVANVKTFGGTLDALSAAMSELRDSINVDPSLLQGFKAFQMPVVSYRAARAFANGTHDTSPQQPAGGQYEIDTDVPMPKSRVARGLVQDTVAMALELEPGKSIKEYEALVLDLQPEISVKSVGNELRRGERDGRYKRDRPGGYRWYLGSAEIEAADNVSAEDAASHSNQGGDDDPDNMT